MHQESCRAGSAAAVAGATKGGHGARARLDVVARRGKCTYCGASLGRKQPGMAPMLCRLCFQPPRAYRVCRFLGVGIRIIPGPIATTKIPVRRAHRGAMEKDETILTCARFLGGALVSVAGLAAPGARSQSARPVAIDGARKTPTDLRHDQVFGNAAKLLHQAMR